MDRPSAPHRPASPTTFDGWCVVCLCAEWCGVCREYEGAFKELASTHPHARFLWIDVEDQEDTLEDVDVETFPTVLIAHGGYARFMGPLLPQVGVLDRLLRSLMEQQFPSAGVDPAAQALWGRLRAAAL